MAVVILFLMRKIFLFSKYTENLFSGIQCIKEESKISRRKAELSCGVWNAGIKQGTNTCPALS